MTELAVARPVTARFDFRSSLTRRRAVVLLWLAFAALRLAVLPLIGATPHDSDDWMRLFEVRDFIAGQGWYDVTQYRIDPAGGGASMHWSRLVDLPLILLVMLFSGVMPMAHAEMAAMIIVPLLYLLVAMLALRSVMLRVGLHPPVILGALALLPLFPLVLSQFAPMRIDHNVPQAVLAVVCAALVLKNGDRAACWAGVVAALWAVISLEALPMVALIAATYGLRYVLWGDRSIRWYLVMLTLGSASLTFGTRPASAFSTPYCDILMPGHMAAFALAAVIAFALPWLPGQDDRRGRVLALAAIPALCIPLALFGLGQCAVDPMGRLDPMLKTWWHGQISEGLPIWQQSPSVVAMVLWTGAIIAAGWHRARIRHADRAPQWLLLGVLAGGACLYSFWLMREALVAQLLAVPFAAMLLAHYWPRVRSIRHAVPRILATVACLLLVTPSFASATGKPFDALVPGRTMDGGSAAPMAEGKCDYARLATLPQGHVLASLDSGPEILGNSPHSVVAASYHRNQRAMKAVLSALTGPVDRGVAIARDEGADYVAACLSRADTALYRTAAPDNLANALAGKGPIEGLEPVAGFENGPLRVWRVMRDGNPSPRR